MQLWRSRVFVRAAANMWRGNLLPPFLDPMHFLSFCQRGRVTKVHFRTLTSEVFSEAKCEWLALPRYQ